MFGQQTTIDNYKNYLDKQDKTQIEKELSSIKRSIENILLYQNQNILLDMDRKVLSELMEKERLINNTLMKQAA